MRAASNHPRTAAHVPVPGHVVVAPVVLGEHRWVVSATIPVTDREADTATRRKAFKCHEGRRVKALEAYCFAGETRYLTRDGVRTFAETVGTSQVVLAQRFAPDGGARAGSRTDGQWVEAEIQSFGEQRLLTVTLTRNGITKVIRATPNHRWFAARSDGGQATHREYETGDLRPGMVLASLTTRFAPRQTVPSPFGIAHGVVFGDGSRKNQRGSTVGTGTRIDLWGEKDAQLLRYFNGSPAVPCKTVSGLDGIRVTDLPSFFKDEPSLDESVAYLYGWLAGYFAADGAVSPKGTPSLSSARRDHLEFVQRVCLRLGVAVYGITEESRQGFGSTPTPLYRMGFVRSTLRPEFFLIAEHRARFIAHTDSSDRMRWRVVNVEDHGEAEEVFCAVVPEYASFTLEDYIWTHNCEACRRAYEDAAGTLCTIEQVHKGGPIDTRKRRTSSDDDAQTVTVGDR